MRCAGLGTISLVAATARDYIADLTIKRWPSFGISPQVAAGRYYFALSPANFRSSIGLWVLAYAPILYASSRLFVGSRRLTRREFHVAGR